MNHDTDTTGTRKRTPEEQTIFTLSPDLFIGVWICLFALCMLPNLNNSYPLKGDESFFTVSAMNMIRRGEPLTPWYFGAYRFNKPILTYLVVMASYGFFGISMWSARLTMLAITCITLLITYRCALFLFGSRPKAVLAACIQSACYLCVGFARIAMAEPLLTLFTLCALYSYLVMIRRKQRRFLLGCSGALFSGLAFMSKGPAGLFPFVAIIIYSIVAGKDQRGRLLRAACNPLSFGIMALIIAPWCIYIHLNYPHVLGSNLDHEAGTLSGALNPVRTVTRVSYYIASLLLVHLPFSVAAAYTALRKGKRNFTDIAFLLWFCGIFLFTFFFVIDIHKERYLTSIAPAVSMIFADIIYSEKWKKWITTACIVSLFQIMLYNAYPLFSHEALRTLVCSWKETYGGTLGLPLDKKRAGWCRLYAGDNNIVPADSADYVIIADRDTSLFTEWNRVQTEKRLSSLRFRGTTPVVNYRIFHLLKRPDRL